LRRQLARLGIEGAHTRPRLEIIEDYARTLKRIGQNAASAAIDEWLAAHKGLVMLEYSGNKYGKWRRVDIESVWLGDRLANELTQPQLFAELTKMKCPRIKPDMGRPDLIFCLGIFQQELAEAKRAGAAAK
jgi:hypothetical protein